MTSNSKAVTGVRVGVCRVAPFVLCGRNHSPGDLMASEAAMWTTAVVAKAGPRQESGALQDHRGARVSDNVTFVQFGSK